MKVNRLTLASLRTFSEVAGCLSFTRAAALVFRSQPALSRQIAQLENDLGLKLFERDGRTLTLTAGGRELLVRAQLILSEAEGFLAHAQALTSGDIGSIRVGATPMSFDWTVPSLLTAYKKRWPKIQVSMVESSTSELMLRVESRNLDIAVMRYVTTDALEARRLFPMYLAAIMDPQHPLAKTRAIEVVDLVQEPLLLMPPDAGSRVLLDQACRESGNLLRRVRLESRAYGALVEMAHAGHGVAVVLSTVFNARPDIHAIPIVHRGRQLGLWAAMVWRRDVQLQPYAKAFLDTAAKLCRKGYPGEHFGAGELAITS